MSTQELQVDNDFASLIPPLNKDEYSHLEQSILHEGCRDPIITWNGIIVDGHHRFKICKEHNVPFKTVHKEFASRDEVFLWILNNQLARRNLNAFRRIEMARNYERAVKAQAKARQGTRNDIKQLSGNFSGMSLPTGRDARDELGAMAGVSGNTYQHAIYVLNNAPVPIIEAARNNSISINAAYELTKMTQTQQTEALRRIEQGESAKSVISQIKSRDQKSQPDTTTANSADYVQPQSAASETSFHNEDVNSQHEANTTAMNEEKQPQEVSSTIHTQTQTQQLEPHRQLKLEATEHEILQQTQPASEHSDSLYEANTDYNQYEEEEYNYDDYDDYDVFEEEEEEEDTRIDIFNTDKSYSIIYADPSWEYYQSTEELLKLPVRRVADVNCALFLWGNPSRLHEAQEVIKQWGFSNEKIVFVWVKTTEDDNGQQSYYLGQTGNWTRENVEFCLIATKGTIQRVNDNIPQGVLCPIEKEKPDYVKPELFKQLTVQLLGNLPTLELFPDPYALDLELQFSTTYNGKRVEWDMAAPKVLLEQLAEDRRIEINM